jgi:hypothetical protein
LANEAPRRRGRLRWIAGALALLTVAGILTVVLSSEGDPGASPRSLTRPERKAIRLERRLAANPGDQGLWLRAIRAWSEAAGSWLFQRDFGDTRIPAAVREDLIASVQLWDRYLQRTGGKAGADLAEIAGEIAMELAEVGSRNPFTVEDYVATASRAAEISGELRPNLFTLSNVAVYAYFNGEPARADIAASKAAKTFRKKARRKIVVEQLNAYHERADVFRQLLTEAKAELRESGDELLEQPLKAYVHSVGINTDDPTE